MGGSPTQILHSVEDHVTEILEFETLWGFFVCWACSLCIIKVNISVVLLVSFISNEMWWAGSFVLNGVWIFFIQFSIVVFDMILVVWACTGYDVCRLVRQDVSWCLRTFQVWDCTWLHWSEFMFIWYRIVLQNSNVASDIFILNECILSLKFHLNIYIIRSEYLLKTQFSSVFLSLADILYL